MEISLGFDVGELPRDLFASMLTYYYNSYHATYVEEWPGKGCVFVHGME